MSNTVVRARERPCKISICTITARAEPCYDWLLDDLARQRLPEDVLEIVIIDFYNRSADILVGPRPIPVRVYAPKPCPWQGPQRVTTQDYHAIANARNTALCLASYGYVAFVDDRSHLEAGWLPAARAGFRKMAAICGPCDKRKLDGELFDHRRALCPKGKRGCGGGWFYGGNFAAPLEWLLEVNGHEEGTDPSGCQDYVMGCMMANRGRRIDFVASMGVQQDRCVTPSHPFPVPRSETKHAAINARFLNKIRTEMTPDLRAMRYAVQRGQPFPMHGMTADTLDWHSGVRVGDM